jgi:hypothetical protein
MNPNPTGSNFRNPWLWAALALALVVLAVNAGFVAVARMSNPGLVTEDYVKHGQHQNLLDAQYRAQSARGWHVALHLPLELHSGAAVDARVSARARDGAALRGGRVEMMWFRPSDAAKDVGIDFAESADAPGEYAAAVVIPAPGVWDVSVLFEAEGERFMLNRRVLVDPPPGYVRRVSALERIVALLIDAP